MGHPTCCKNLPRPKTPKALADLPYPSNQKRDRGASNRIVAPEQTAFKSGPARHKKWWIRLDGATPLLDGSGDGIVRGWVTKCVDLTAKKEIGICLNAASLKLMPPPKGEPGYGKQALIPYGFTFRVYVLPPECRPLSSNKPNPPTPPPPGKRLVLSGWVPLHDLAFKTKNKTLEKKYRAKIADLLRGWACCIDRYASWGKSLQAKKAPTPLAFRSVQELESELDALAGGKSKLTSYFREGKAGKGLAALRKVIKSHKGEGRVGKVLALAHICSNHANRLGDYLPRLPDAKPSGNGGPDGYVNLCPNFNIWAGVTVDVFPADHVFHRCHFQKGAALWADLHYAPGDNPRTAKGLIAKTAIYWGYCDMRNDDKDSQRVYGWVPALALKAV
jgi:hypothetical protein